MVIHISTYSWYIWIYYSLMCSNWYILVCWLLPIERSMRCNITRLYLSVRRYKSVNSFSIAYPVAFQAAVYATWNVSSSNCGSGVLSLHLSHRAVGVMRHGCHEVANIERGLLCWMQVPSFWSRISDVAQPLLGAVASTLLLLVYNYINNLLHFTQVFNIVISLSRTSH